ncbi:class I SAM-dependent methyltransferase [Rhodospira trueperi]|uniref:Methyltransferase domain-containing protein n=1 Tax=Rhodospira trueperi TaxID=69960 RepID=A0A1G7B2L7_9PROT|nr:class I SAM-dependent methyltransferase [Rhodospira trueperi]SDE20506.1 Methyltransferase domain-containing protein [Rhodospira trueperi]
MTADFWDQRYADRKYVYGVEPNAFLTRQRHRLDRGMSVLAVADGEGRNGVWLASHGMRVHAVDYSAVALQKAMRLALDRGVTLRTTCADLTDWTWPTAAYDAVVCLFLHLGPEHRAAVHRAMAGALAPGGLLIMEAFHPAQLRYGTGGPPNAEMLYDPDTLAADFGGLLDIDVLEDGETDLDEGAHHQGRAHTTRLVGRAPMAETRPDATAR